MQNEDENYALTKLDEIFRSKDMNVDLSFVDLPAQISPRKKRVVEVLSHKDGETRISHYYIMKPTIEKDIVYIANMVIEQVSPTIEYICNVITRYNINLQSEKIIALHEKHKETVIYIPCRLLDVTRRELDFVLKLPFAKKHIFSNSQSILDKDFSRNISAHTFRCDSNRKKTPIYLGNLFSLFLQSHPQGIDVFEQTLPSLRKTIDQSSEKDYPIIVSKVTGHSADSSIKWTILFNKIHLDNYVGDGWHINGERLYLEVDPPETIVRSLSGKKLHDVIKGLPISNEAIIKRANTVRSSNKSNVKRKLSISLEGQPVNFDEMKSILRKTKR